MSTTTRPPIEHRGKAHPDVGYCYSESDGLDGGCIHTASCVSAGRAWSGPNSTCVQPGQDGEAMKVAREAAADRRKFTPPEYREHPVAPGPAIEIADRQQARDVLAVRGRPRIHDSEGEGEWTTWEELWAPQGDVHWLTRALQPRQPRDLSVAEAEAILAEYRARVPHYEFQIVRARLVVVEDVVA